MASTDYSQTFRILHMNVMTALLGIGLVTEIVAAWVSGAAWLQTVVIVAVSVAFSATTCLVPAFAGSG